MKILFTRFPLESTFGGAEVQTLSLMQELLARGHAVAFLGSCPTLLRLCREQAIPCAEVHIGVPPVTKWGALSFAWRRVAMRRKLEAALDQFHDIDAVLMLSLSEKLLLTPRAVSMHLKVLWIEHDTVGRWLTKNPWLSQLQRQSEKVTTVCVSELSKAKYLELGWPEARTVSIPNGVQKPEKVSHQPSKAGLHLGCIARLTHDKGVDVLLQALASVSDVSLSLLGRGRERQSLEKMVHTLHLTSRVTFTEFVEDLDAFYASLDALVLPSREHDPFGLVVAEAMMREIPVIVTDACGIAGELQDGKDALIIEAGNVEALQHAIFTMKDAHVRITLSQEGKRTAEEKFTLQKMVDRYETLLR